MVWYYADGDRQRGPVSDEEFQEMVDHGRIREETLVWKDGMENWQPLKSAAEAGLVTISPAPAQPLSSPATPLPGMAAPQAPSAPQAPTGHCAQCARGPLGSYDSVKLGNILLCKACNEDMARHYELASHNTSGPAAGVTYDSPQELPYASVFQRLLAVVLDNIVQTVVLTVLFMLTVNMQGIAEMLPSPGDSAEDIQATLTELFTGPMRPMLIASYLFNFVYNAVLVAGFGATLGKMTLGIRVSQADGSRVNPVQALIRALLPNILQLPMVIVPFTGLTTILSYVLLFGFAIALFDIQRRTLFDHIAGTRVIRN